MAGCESESPRVSDQPPEKKTKLCPESSSKPKLVSVLYGPDSDEDEFSPEYFKQLNESEGFDIDVYPKSYPKYVPLGYILPIPNLDKDIVWLEALTKLSKLAIKHFNEEHNTSYDFSKVVKANRVPCSFARHYITFEAKDAIDGQLKTFQAMVSEGVEINEVLMCRLKATN